MVMQAHIKDGVIRALFSAHPYEEPAYDLYPQHDFRELSHAVWIGEFDKPCSWEALLETIRRSTPIPPEFVCVHPRQDKPIQKIALSTGSGSSMIPLVAGLGVDVYLTGEVGYHPMWEAEERGLNVITVGHGVSESFFPETVIPLLQTGTQDIEWISAVGV
jgi:putative NIF3 family GTP cyclohydrolase 1 type 2